MVFVLEIGVLIIGRVQCEYVWIENKMLSAN